MVGSVPVVLAGRERPPSPGTRRRPRARGSTGRAREPGVGPGRRRLPGRRARPPGDGYGQSSALLPARFSPSRSRRHRSGRTRSDHRSGRCSPASGSGVRTHAPCASRWPRPGIHPATRRATGLVTRLLKRARRRGSGMRLLLGRTRKRAPPPRGPFERNRRRPTLPGDRSPSTIGAGGLNFRVRNGNGCRPTAMATETSVQTRRRLEAGSPLRTP